VMHKTATIGIAASSRLAISQRRLARGFTVSLGKSVMLFRLAD
jgi:hypothetical protein